MREEEGEERERRGDKERRQGQLRDQKRGEERETETKARPGWRQQKEKGIK